MGSLAALHGFITFPRLACFQTLRSTPRQLMVAPPLSVPGAAHISCMPCHDQGPFFSLEDEWTDGGSRGRGDSSPSFNNLLLYCRRYRTDTFRVVSRPQADAQAPSLFRFELARGCNRRTDRKKG